MEKKLKQINPWLKSKEAEKELQISSCDLMHLRTEGKLVFKKEGNSFLYETKSIEVLKKERI